MEADRTAEAFDLTGVEERDMDATVTMIGQLHCLSPHTIGEALHLLRFRARLSRDDVVEGTSVGAGTLSRYENDVTQKLNVTLLRELTTYLAEEADEDPDTVWHEMGVLMDQTKRARTAEDMASPYEVRRERRRK